MREELSDEEIVAKGFLRDLDGHVSISQRISYILP
jgi:hypothetical protein